MSEIVYLNGRFVPREAAAVSVYDGGWLHGAGLFETLRAHQGSIFRLDAHLERLMESAAKVLFPIERPDLPLTSEFQQLLHENQLADARVRLTVTAGSTVDGGGADRHELNVCVTASPRPAPQPELQVNGVAVLISSFRQSRDDPLAGHKTTNYLARLLALRQAQKARCVEALWFTPENWLAEGSISNVFVVKAGVVKTPPLNTPVLPGITRAVVLELCRARGREAVQTPLSIDDLLDADEAFITNSGMGITPVIRVEKHDLAGGTPGTITLDLARLHEEQVRTECGETPPR